MMHPSRVQHQERVAQAGFRLESEARPAVAQAPSKRGPAFRPRLRRQSPAVAQTCIRDRLLRSELAEAWRQLSEASVRSSNLAEPRPHPQLELLEEEEASLLGRSHAEVADEAAHRRSEQAAAYRREVCERCRAEQPFGLHHGDASAVLRRRALGVVVPPRQDALARAEVLGAQQAEQPQVDWEALAELEQPEALVPSLQPAAAQALELATSHEARRRRACREAHRLQLLSEAHRESPVGRVRTFVANRPRKGVREPWVFPQREDLLGSCPYRVTCRVTCRRSSDRSPNPHAELLAELEIAG
jgi:hypothetical protein